MMSRASLFDALRLYRGYVAVSIRAQMQYRVSFLLQAFGQFAVTGIEFLGVWALFDRFGRRCHWPSDGGPGGQIGLR